MAENPRTEELRRRLEREPGSRLFAQLAEELRKDGNHAEAIRVARAGLAQQPNYPSARMTLGRSLLDSGDLTGARVEFETVLRGASDNILASRFLGECLEGLGDLGSALLQYRAAQRLAPADKNLEAQIHALEQKLSAPTPIRPLPPPAPPPVASVAESSAPPPAQAPTSGPPPPPDRIRTVTAEFEPRGPAAPPAAPRARPPLPLPPEPEPAASPTLIEESFDLEAPFNAPTQLRAEESPTLPGRALPDEETVFPEAPTLPATPAPRFEPVFAPDPPRALHTEPAREVPLPTPAPTPTVVAPTPESVADAHWRAPAPPRLRSLDESQETGSRAPDVKPAVPVPTAAPAPPAAAESVDTTRVPVVVFPIPAAVPKAPLDAIRLEWAAAPARPLTPPAALEAPAAPAAPVAPPVPAPPHAPVAAPEPVMDGGPLLSPTLAELYFGQGALDKAIHVYEQLLEREPANERIRIRLSEIRVAASPPAAPADDHRAARRRTIEAQIARLEQLLTVLRRA